MLNKFATLIAAVAGASMAGTTRFTIPGGRTVSATQERMHAKWLADAPRRAALAAEIAAWNRNVKRRNQRFVARQLARGRAA
jgi:hypothetical protein